MFRSHYSARFSSQHGDSCPFTGIRISFFSLVCLTGLFLFSHLLGPDLVTGRYCSSRNGVTILSIIYECKYLGLIFKNAQSMKDIAVKVSVGVNFEIFMTFIL